ncbi:MAG: MBL fold metallo-hydrolase [Parachlamydiaceae bacterium]|nr:MBL fold metallo-hydrolase [Parachlamydiaceae bacterium]
MKKCRLVFLGTGGSMGVPVIACQCQVCTSLDPHNQRLRPSVLIKTDLQTILIDSSPDFRTQALRAKIQNIDNVIFTHAHHDHTAGVDDLRIFTLRNNFKMPCLLSQETLRDLQKRFYYIFEEIVGKPKFTTNLEITLLPEVEGEIAFAGLNIRSFTYRQCGMAVNGLRFGNFAFLTDIKEYDPEIFNFLKGVKILVISALRFTPSIFHLTVDEAIEFAAKVGAEKVWLTHIAHELDHEKTNAYLPEHIRLSYDGLEFEFEAEEA